MFVCVYLTVLVCMCVSSYVGVCVLTYVLVRECLSVLEVCAFLYNSASIIFIRMDPYHNHILWGVQILMNAVKVWPTAVPMGTVTI